MAIVHFVNYKRGTQSRAAMRGVMLYVMQEKKTAWEGAPLISGINCQPQSVYDDFINTKLLYHKAGGVMFYHMVQSFPKGAEVDPRQAHEAARRLAEYFEGCEVLICTHVDREHVHSHCVINSVNFDTGKKLHMAKEQLQELMRRNDMICQEMGLPGIDRRAFWKALHHVIEHHAVVLVVEQLRVQEIIVDALRLAVDAADERPALPCGFLFLHDIEHHAAHGGAGLRAPLVVHEMYDGHTAHRPSMTARNAALTSDSTCAALSRPMTCTVPMLARTVRRLMLPPMPLSWRSSSFCSSMTTIRLPRQQAVT